MCARVVRRALLLRACERARTTTLRGQHFGQLLVLQAALEELVLRQLAVVVLVHLGENVLGAVLGRVGRPVGRTRAQHVVDRLRTRKNNKCILVEVNFCPCYGQTD